MKIAWIGVGVMGRHMCGHLMKGGHSAAVYSRTASKCAELVANGATLAPTPKAAAQDADAVRPCASTSSESLAAAFRTLNSHHLRVNYSLPPLLCHHPRRHGRRSSPWSALPPMWNR